jgi:hypothetical protein
MMKVLIVGAGAVGQIYGHYYAEGGSKVTYLVKPRHVEELNQGLQIFNLNRKEKKLFKNFQIITDLPTLSHTQWDIVVLTVASDALYTPWLKEFLSSINKNATLVTLQPGSNDREEIIKFFPEDKIVTGVITLVAFPTPLGNKWPQEKGMAVWFPPFGKAPFDGRPEEVKKAISPLLKAGFPSASKSINEKPEMVAYGSTFLGLFVRNLELQGWKLSAFGKREASNLISRSTKEALEVVSRSHNVSSPFVRHFLTGVFYRTAIALAKFTMPFDLEAYLEFHFTKVGPQMRMGLENLQKDARALGMNTPNLDKVISRSS